MASETETIDKVRNSIFIVLFSCAVCAIIIFTIQSGFRMDFINQTGVASLILYVICIAISFMYISPTWMNAHSYISIALLIIPTIAIFWNKLHAPPANLQYLKPYNLVLALCGLAFIKLLWLNNPAQIFSTQYSSIATLFMSLMVTFAILAGITTFAVPSGPAQSFLFKALRILFGIVTSAMFIGWVAWIIAAHSQKTGWLSMWFLVALMFVMYLLVVALFKAMGSSRATAAKSNSFANLINATIMYLPCLVNDWWARIKAFGQTPRTTPTMPAVPSFITNATNNIATTSTEFWALLAISGALLVGYYYLPSVNKKIYIGNCQQLLSNPITLHGATTIATFDQLNKGTTTTATFDYQYGISLWYYLDAHGANMNAAYNTYTSLFNYGNKPTIEYNGSTNSLRIKMGGAKEPGRTVYETRGNVSLQKWTNIVVNYHGGVVDVFIDGKLIKSVESVAPYMSLDNLVVGAQDGLYGKCCNVIYCPNPFTADQIYYLQYLVKDSNPPVFTGQFI